MKVYVRERLDAGEGETRPRFQVVAVAGEGLHLYTGLLRKTELERIAKDVGADVVYLEPMPVDLKRKKESS
jgi:hypothetical protein